MSIMQQSSKAQDRTSGRVVPGYPAGPGQIAAFSAL